MMRIAITQRVVEHAAYSETRDALACDWMRWADQAFPGAALVPVPNATPDPVAWAQIVDPDLLVLSGGNDLGERPERDLLERALLEWFRDRGRPILAVCRGLQLVNEQFGGRLTTGLHTATGHDHAGVDHHVRLGVPFSAMAGCDAINVNSFHDHGVCTAGVGASLCVFAVDEHDVVEGLVHETEPILAVQWHPERRDPVAPFDVLLARGLVAAGAFWR